MPQTIIRAEHVEKYYAQPSANRIQVIAPTDLQVFSGEILALLGPSGSGKSTLLRMRTGLSKPSAGQVYWHDQPIATTEPNVSIVFQSFALFPWLTVLENVEAPLQARGMDAAEQRRRGLKILDTVGLDGFQTAYPKELSGGMRQRVGFARALVVEPEVLFMDEPFSALDVLTAENLRSELLELWQKKTIPTKAIFLVTHNIEEAVLLADRMLAQIAASVPATALFPVVLLPLIKLGGGLGIGSIALMLLGTQWYILFNVIAGAMAIPTDLKEVATLFRFSKVERWKKLILPGIFPYLVTGMVTASGGAWNASIIAEYYTLGGRTLTTLGLGEQITAATANGQFPIILLGTILISMVVVTTNRLVWRPLYRLAETRYRLDG